MSFPSRPLTITINADSDHGVIGQIGRSPRDHIMTYATRRDLSSSSSTMKPASSVDGLTQPVPSCPSLPPSSAHTSTDVCARLLTTTLDGRTEALILSLGKPITIGRSPKLCSYVVPDIVVSSLHCKIYAVRSGAGGIVISCQDLSTNGIVINGHKVRKTSAILMHGDTLKIPASQSFQCVFNSRHLPVTRPSQISNSQSQAFKDMGRYRITSHCLGTGSYASVHLALDTSAHRQVACKIVRRKEGNDLKKEMKEATILTSLHHPNINRVYAFDYDSEFLYIMLQLSTGGDLFSYITNHPRHKLCEGEAKYITFQLLKGLQYLHDRMISHRGLFVRDRAIFPENILLHSPGPYPRIQIADFGLARPRAYEETLHVCGTISYLPPEGVRALENKRLGYVGMPADCWSAGIVIFAMLTGSHPFDYGDPRDLRTENYSQDGQDSKLEDAEGHMGFSQPSQIQDEITKQRILDGTVYYCEPIWATLRDAKNLVNHLLISDPQKRATVYAALRSFWITSDLADLERAYRERIRSSTS